MHAPVDILEDADWSLSCIGIILFELHGGKITAQTKNPYTVPIAIRHVRRLEQAGFVHYMTEQVYTGGNAAAELAFVNLTWLATNPGLPTVPLPPVWPPVGRPLPKASDKHGHVKE